MRRPRRTILTILALLACCGSPALADNTPGGTPEARPTSGSDRLFLAFAEDATLVDRQWWEGRVVYEDYNHVEVTGIEGRAAFQPWVDWEVGGAVGFADTNVSGGQDGSGATDFDLWAKYHLGGGQNTEWAVGGVLTIPTGDETAGLGADAFGASAFGAMRHRLRKLVVAAHLGLQFNGDGRRFSETNDRDGETAPQLGAGVIYPFSDNLGGVAEIRWRGGRLKHDDDDARILGGINWRPGGRGIFRAAIGAGFEDGAPDFQAEIGYAAQF